MPIRYKLIDGIVKSTATGSMSANDMVEHIKQLVADPEIPSLFVEIIDLNQASVETTIGENEALYVASKAKALITRFTVVHTVIVASPDLLYGLSRMFETYHNLEAPHLNWYVVRSQAEVQDIIDSILGADAQ